jgi:hypothetical protein
MTDYLFATPSFIGGMARVLDLGSTLNVYNTSQTPQEADRNAFLSDWLAIGNDLMAALSKYEEKNKVK